MKCIRIIIMITVAVIILCSITIAQTLQKVITITLREDKNGKVIQSDTNVLVINEMDSIFLHELPYFEMNIDSKIPEFKIRTACKNLDSNYINCVYFGDSVFNKFIDIEDIEQVVSENQKIMDSMVLIIDKNTNCKNIYSMRPMNEKLIICNNDSIFIQTDSILNDINIQIQKVFDEKMNDANIYHYRYNRNGKDKGKHQRIIICENVTITELSPSDKEIIKSKGIQIEDSNASDLIENLKFSPNPNNGKFNLEFSVPKELETTISIYSLGGREVFKKDLGKFSGKFNEAIDLTDKGKGTFILVIKRGLKQISKKIVLN